MRKYKHKKIKIGKDNGAAMLVFTVFVFFTSFIIIVGISRPALREFSITQNALNSRQTYFLSESGLEDAYYRIKNGKQVSASENLVLGSSTATTTISDIGGGQKQISSLADTNTNQRKVNLVLDSSSSSTVVNLSYTTGLHAGTSGVLLYSDSGYGDMRYTGDIYSVGPIVLYGTARVTGNLFANGSSGSIAYHDPYNIGSGYIVTGNSSAHTVKDTTASGTIYCQTGSNNNKSCNTSQSDPSVPAIPDLSSQITAWKNEAAAGSVYGFDYATQKWYVGPKKINGDFTMYGDMVLTGPLWVTGHINIIQAGKKVSLSSNFGSGDGVIIGDDDIMIGSSGTQSPTIFEGSGSSDSNILIIGTNTGYSSALVNNVSGNILVHTPNGRTNLMGSATGIKGVIAKWIQIGGATNANTTYSTGPSSLNFGPDTYGINSWKETQ